LKEELLKVIGLLYMVVLEECLPPWDLIGTLTGNLFLEKCKITFSWKNTPSLVE